MKASEALIAWTPSDMDLPTRGKVKVRRLLRENEPDWTLPYFYVMGAKWVARREMSGWESIAQVFIEFHSMVLRDGIDPKVAHEAFLAIDEYAENCDGGISRMVKDLSA